MWRRLLIVALIALSACSENPNKRPADAAFDQYKFQFPEAGDLLAPDMAPPGVDRCWGAKTITLGGGKATINDSTAKANNEFGDQVRCGEPDTSFDGPQLYYGLATTAGKVYKLELQPDFDAVLYLFSECSKTLINVDCASGGATGAYSGAIPKGSTGGITFVAPASGTHLIAVDSADAGQSGAFKLTVEELDAPAHASCSGAKPLTLGTPVTDSTLGAKNEFTTQLTCGLSATLDGPQLYYSVELTAGSWYRLSLEPSFTATLYVAAAAANCTAANIETDCSGITGTVLPLVPQGGKAATLFRPLTSGSYLVVVDSPDPKQAGDFTLTVESSIPGDNTVCDSATALTLQNGQASAAGDTSTLLNDRGALMSCNSGAPLVGPQAYYSVDLEAKTYRLVLKPDFPALLAVGQSCATLPLDCLGGGTGGDAVAVNPASFGQLLFTPQAAGPHVISVDSQTLNAAGSFTLQLSEYQTPTNGSCTSPASVTLTQSPAETLGDTGPLKNDLAGVDCGNAAGPWPGPQAYYRVSLKAGVQVTVTLTPEATFDPALYAFPAATTCDASAINAACQGLSSDAVGAGSSESLTLQPTTDTDYLLVVDSWSASEVGSFSLSLAWP